MKQANPFRWLLPFMVTALCYSSVLFAQPINISFSNTPIKNVLREITKQIGYNFVYSDALTELDNRINIDYNIPDASIETLLDKIFEGTDIKYSITDKQVALLNNTIERGSVNSVQTIYTQQQPPLPNSALITGVIKNAMTNEALIGVVVNVKGTQIFAVSDANGTYRIMAPADATLVFTILGMVPREMAVSSRTNIPVFLDPDVISMKEIIVTGYQTLSKERATGSFGIIGATDLEDKMQPSLASVLEGQVAGLTVNQNNQIEIRGVTTLNALTAPLIVIDGFPVDASLNDGDFFRYRDGILENINVDNVESITILKDGVAASIYGARAANGVVVIVTKKGRQGDAQFTYRGTFGFAARPDLSNLNKASTNDYIDAEIDMFNLNPSNFNINTGTSVITEVIYLLKQAEQGLITQAQADARINELRKNDFLKELEEHVFRPQFSHQHNFMVNGGTEKNSYSLAANYMNTEQNFKYAQNDRLTVDIKDEWKFNKYLTVGASVSLTYSNLETPMLNPDRSFRSGDSYGSQKLFNFHQNSYFTPYTSIVNSDGSAADIWGLSPYKQQTYGDYDGMKAVNYDFLNDLRREMIYTTDFQARLTGYAKIHLMEGLEVDLGGNWQRGSYKYQSIQQKDAFAVREAYNDSKSKKNPANHYLPDGAIVNENRSNSESWTIRTQVNFSRDFADSRHRVTAFVGNEVRKNTLDKVILATRMGYKELAGAYTPMNILDYNSTIYGNDMLFGRRISLNTGNYGYRDNRFVSWYGNGSYEYNDRYLITGSVRLDLTNFFGTDKKYRYKPLWSVGGTWKLSNENFFDVDFVNRLYLRASYGLNGNIKLDQGPFLILSTGSYNSVSQGMSYGISSPPNNQLRWEKTNSANIGLDATLFNGRLDLTLEWYRKYTSDVLASEAVDQTVGFTTTMMNVGEIKNTGIEVSLLARIIDNADFGWRLSTNFAYNKNIIEKYNVTLASISSYLGASGENIAGYPVGGLWALRWAPLNSTGNAMVYNADGDIILSSEAKPGDAYYVGPTRPLCDISVTNRFNHKNWELSFMIISKLGHYYQKDAFHSRNIQNKHVGERWKQAGDEAWAKVPALTVTNTDYWNAPNIDINMNKANFARLRDVTLTYSFNNDLVKKIGLSGAKVYIQGRNLITVKAKGMDIDPETVVPYTGSYGGYTDFSFSSLALPKEIFLGIQITF